MKKLIYIIMILALTSCGKRNSPQLMVYVNQFVEDAAKRGIKVDLNKMLYIQYGKTAKGVAGTCYKMRKLGVYRIVVAKFASKYPKESLKALVYHEMGHCALNLKHEDENHNIMNKRLRPNTLYVKHWDWLVDILFESY